MTKAPSTNPTATPRPPLLRWLAALLAGLVIASGSVLAAQTAGALTPPGKPKAEVVGATAVKLTWTAVSGAPGYRVQYSTSSSFSSPKYLPASGSTTYLTKPSAVVTELTVNTTYYFRVAIADATNSATLSSYSSYVSAKPVYSYAAPTGMVVDNVSGTSIELVWIHVSGAPGYRVRAYSSGNPTVYTSSLTNNATVRGLKKGTLYYIKVYVEQPPTDDLPALQMGPYGSEIQVKTSSYDLAAPDEVAVTGQTSSSVQVSWKAPEGMKTGYQYQAQYALDSGMTSSMVWSSKVTDTKITLSGLKQNTNYYVRVRVVDSTGAQKSDRSDYIMAKTRVPAGFISGTVNGPPPGDVVASAYGVSGEVVQQVDVGSDRKYTLRVRPGTYKVQITYVGTGKYTSFWAKSGSGGGRISGEASSLTVSLNKTTTAPTVTLVEGAVVKGVIRYPLGTNPDPIAAVDVTALSGMTSAREVMASSLSASDGTYTLRGLADGQYWLRMVYSSDGFQARSIWVNIQDAKIIGVRVSTSATPTVVTTSNPITAVNTTLPLADFRTKYKAYIYGTKSVGVTLTSRATPWLAGSYPTTRASMSYQWKRNDVAIPGATGATYKLTSSDKGKYISLTVTARRYGYITGTATSTAYKVS